MSQERLIINPDTELMNQGVVLCQRARKLREQTQDCIDSYLAKFQSDTPIFMYDDNSDRDVACTSLASVIEWCLKGIIDYNGEFHRSSHYTRDLASQILNEVKIPDLNQIEHQLLTLCSGKFSTMFYRFYNSSKYDEVKVNKFEFNLAVNIADTLLEYCRTHDMFTQKDRFINYKEDED